MARGSCRGDWTCAERPFYLAAHVIASPVIGLHCTCLPSSSKTPPSGKEWLHEIKHDGFCSIVRKEGKRVKLYSRPGNDLTYRFPLVAEYGPRCVRKSCIIDGEVVSCGRREQRRVCS
jgi:ATP-dependent DNA ligase